MYQSLEYHICSQIYSFMSNTYENNSKYITVADRYQRKAKREDKDNPQA